jgi:hypothetical protein
MKSLQMPGDAPLFRHPRLIAAGLIAALAVATGGALYVRPLSGEMRTARSEEVVVRVALKARQPSPSPAASATARGLPALN